MWIIYLIIISFTRFKEYEEQCSSFQNKTQNNDEN